MNALVTEASDLSYSDLPPVLLMGTSDAAIARAERGIGAWGLRIGARLGVGQALKRMELQGAATLLWIEIDRDCGRPMDELLDQVNRDIACGLYAAVVSAPAALVDPLVARLENDAIELIVDADEAERAAALAVATTARSLPLRISDAASDKNSERLRQLSEEVGRIASTLARLSAGPASGPRTLEADPVGDVPQLSAEVVRNVIRARRLRARYFSPEIFADPAWDMMLDLLQAEVAQLRVPVSSLCIASAVPSTTALRWLKAMVAQGLFVRRADPHDGRRVFVELSPETSRALRRYFAEVGPVAVV